MFPANEIYQLIYFCKFVPWWEVTHGLCRGDGPRDVNPVPATKRDLPLGANRVVAKVRYFDQTAEMDYKHGDAVADAVVEPAERKDAGALGPEDSVPINMKEYMPDKQVVTMKISSITFRKDVRWAW